MIHVFNYRDKNYIYDVGSGSLHECDRATADYLRAKEEGEEVDISYITDEQIKEILADVEGLKEQGLLFREETSARPVKSDEIKALCIHICHDCNFRCRYCFADEGAYHAKREFMSPETAKAAVDFLIANSGKRKVLEMDFFGGEPLMNLPVLKETVYYAKAEAAKAGKKFLFTTTTNALLLNDETIRFFNEEMENVVLSLDGRKEVHDAIRKTVNGKGSFDYVIGNIRKFVSLRGSKNYYVRGTFTAKNLDFSKDVLFIADQGLDSISMEPVVTDIPDLKIGEEHLPAIKRNTRTSATNISVGMRRGRDSISSISTSISKGDPAFPSVFPPAARATNISPSCPTAICIPVTSLRGTRNSAWAACGRGSPAPTSGRSSEIPVCSRERSAGTVLRNTSVRAAATPTIIISAGISTSPIRSPAR